MTNLKENIDYYMNLKGIKMYSHLLVDIAHELGIRGQEAYAFADRERANFSKMLKGERPLKYEFIIQKFIYFLYKNLHKTIELPIVR